MLKFFDLKKGRTQKERFLLSFALSKKKIHHIPYMVPRHAQTSGISEPNRKEHLFLSRYSFLTNTFTFTSTPTSAWTFVYFLLCPFLVSSPLLAFVSSLWFSPSIPLLSSLFPFFLWPPLSRLCSEMKMKNRAALAINCRG